MSVPIAVGVIFGIVVVGSTALQLSAQLQTKHRVDLVADNAALAAADSHLGWVEGNPCALAQRVSQHGGAELVSCVLGDLEVVVEVRIQTALGGWLSTAKAGVTEHALGFS